MIPPSREPSTTYIAPHPAAALGAMSNVIGAGIASPSAARSAASASRRDRTGTSPAIPSNHASTAGSALACATKNAR
ncbi:hypothetical protein QP179_11645 [Sphingomonas aurantiaca]|uniref:hypothetical protein n=1 Tax=Sphingomonas aurantiaca TaxID=185949 RepID=UPI002FDF349A